MTPFHLPPKNPHRRIRFFKSPLLFRPSRFFRNLSEFGRISRIFKAFRLCENCVFRFFSSSQCWKTVGNWEELRIFAVWTQHLSLQKLIKTGKLLSFCTLFHWNFEELWNVSERTQWVKPFSKVTNNFRLWVTLYGLVDSTDCQPDRLFSFHYPTVQSIRWGCE